MKNIKNISVQSRVAKHTLCISQTLECLRLWINDSSAFDHISHNASLFSSTSHPKIPHVINLASEPKVTSQGIGEISLSSSLTIKHVLFVPNFP